MKEPNEALAPEAPPGTPEADLSGPAKPEKSPLLREVRSLAVRLAVFAALLWVLLTQVYLVTQASGNEMFPAVKDGDLVLGIRLEKDYVKNDVVVYERSGRLRVGRVLARGGDIVTLGAGRRHPLPHLSQISAQLPLRCAGGQRLHSGRLPHTGRGQP